MDTALEIVESGCAFEREALAGLATCDICNDFIADHPQCESCGKVPVCLPDDLCAGCKQKSDLAVSAEVEELEVILLRMRDKSIDANEAGDRLFDMGNRLGTWDVAEEKL